MHFISKKAVIERLRRSRKARETFVDSHLAKGLAYQVRVTRDERGWSQETLAEKLGTTQNAVYRLESPSYGRPTLTTLKKIAAVFDVGLIVRFVPFSQMADWVSGTPRVDHGLTGMVLAVPSFSTELASPEKSDFEWTAGALKAAQEPEVDPTPPPGFSPSQAELRAEAVASRQMSEPPQTQLIIKGTSGEVAYVAHGDFSQAAWEDAPDWQHESAIHGAEAHLAGTLTPEQSHELWLKEKTETGWSYGEVKDAEKKTHPCFRPYAELPEDQRRKDALFKAVVEALR